MHHSELFSVKDSISVVSKAWWNGHFLLFLEESLHIFQGIAVSRKDISKFIDQIYLRLFKVNEFFSLRLLEIMSNRIWISGTPAEMNYIDVWHCI